MVEKFTSSNFNDIVLQSDKPVLVDFWAEWCGPCRMIAPIIEELSSEYNGRAVIGKLNVDESPDISVNYGVRGIPTIRLRNTSPKFWQSRFFEECPFFW
jgi:thioredoxin 1